MCNSNTTRPSTGKKLSAVESEQLRNPTLTIPRYAQDYFGDLARVQAVRRQLRNWFCSNIQVEDRHPNALDIEASIEAYELLDELLSDFILQQAKQIEE